MKLFILKWTGRELNRRGDDFQTYQHPGNYVRKELESPNTPKWQPESTGNGVPIGIG